MNDVCHVPIYVYEGGLIIFLFRLIVVVLTGHLFPGGKVNII